MKTKRKPSNGEAMTYETFRLIYKGHLKNNGKLNLFREEKCLTSYANLKLPCSYAYGSVEAIRSAGALMSYTIVKHKQAVLGNPYSANLDFSKTIFDPCTEKGKIALRTTLGKYFYVRGFTFYKRG